MSSLQVSAFSLLPTVAVTGAAGFIGRRVAARLLLAGRNVLAVDRVPEPADYPAGVRWILSDMAAGLPEIDGEFDLVHLAWNMDRGRPEAQAEAGATFRRLLDHPGLRGVAGIGSAEEYGEREGCLAEAMAPGSVLSPYGRAKYEAGQALEAWARQSGRRALWLRPFIVYGRGQAGDMAIPYALRQAAARREAEFSAGLQRRDFIHVDDVVAGIVQAVLRLPALESPFAACNLGRGEPVRLRDVLERIARMTGSGDLFHFGARPMREGEPQEQYADLAAARQVLGWTAAISWEQGIDALCREQVRGGNV